ncbi:1405_t:CDS:2, partial [Paraglomus occultum]
LASLNYAYQEFPISPIQSGIPNSNIEILFAGNAINETERNFARILRSSRHRSYFRVHIPGLFLRTKQVKDFGEQLHHLRGKIKEKIQRQEQLQQLLLVSTWSPIRVHSYIHLFHYQSRIACDNPQLDSQPIRHGNEDCELYCESNHETCHIRQLGWISDVVEKLSVD